MPTIDVTDAPQRLLANKSVTPGHCLEYVSRAIRNGEPPLDWDGLDTALDCWNNGCGDKHDSRNVPRGFPAFLGSKRGSNAGDVIISLGDGKFAATDWPGWGVVGICTLKQREAQTGRKYLGYAGEFLGYTLTSTATASLDATRIIPIIKEKPMSLSITHVVRKGVGEFIMYASATEVSLSAELSTATADRKAFELRVAQALAVAAGFDTDYKIPTLDDSTSGGWYLRNQLALRVAGMPADYALAPDKPFNALTYYRGDAPAAVAPALPQTFTFTGTATATAQ